MLKFNFKYGKCPPFNLSRSNIANLKFNSIRSDVIRAMEDNVSGLDAEVKSANELFSFKNKRFR